MRCSFCKNEAVYFRANEGKYYCKNHFIRSVEKRVKRTIGQNKLVEDGDVIAVALSGGKDSTNTLYMLHKFFSRNPKVRLFAVTVNEGIKGYREKVIEKASKLCKMLGVEHHVFSFKDEFGVSVDEIARKVKTNVCTYCGVLRRYLLNKKSRELGATKLATGHNLDDEAQSLLMNLLKGDLLRLVRCGPKPMIQTHKKFVLRIKPLVAIPEEESTLYNKLNRIPSYPRKACPYSKTNALRGYARKFFNELEKESPGIKYSFVENMYKIVPVIKRKLKVTERIRECKLCGEPTSREICKVCKLLEELRR